MTIPIVAPIPAAQIPPRPGSRAARMAMPRSVDALKSLAVQYGVCVRPVALRRTDLGTGRTEVIDLPCGATLEVKCPSCAKRARQLRQVQIRHGWHRTDEPNPAPNPASEGQQALIRLRAHFEFYRAEAERGRPGTRSPTSIRPSRKSSRPSRRRVYGAGSPRHTSLTTTAAPTGIGGSGRPGVVRTYPTCPARRSRRGPPAAPTSGGTGACISRPCG